MASETCLIAPAPPGPPAIASSVTKKAGKDFSAALPVFEHRVICKVGKRLDYVLNRLFKLLWIEAQFL